MVKENPDYCVRITGSDVYGKSKLDYFISVSSPYPVIATTSELLSTGADCKMTKLIVLDKTVESMTTSVSYTHLDVYKRQVSVVLFLVCAVLCVIVYFSLTKEDDGLTKAQRKELKAAKKAAAKGGK